MSSVPGLQPLVDAVAVIDEARCIGCTLCIQACPVDAIVGAAKLMHTVIAASCTGCELCIPPCPVDCIDVRRTAPRDAATFAAATARARQDYELRNQRLQRIKDAQSAKDATQRDAGMRRRKHAAVAKAVERARQRLADRHS
jgi:electron transport complex protein RnfB